MASRKRQLQTRQSKSTRMKRTTVKETRLAQGLDAVPNTVRRSGITEVEPSPATDAVLSGLPVGFRAQVQKEIGLVAAIMAVMTIFLVLLVQRDGEPLVTPAAIGLLGVMIALTVGLCTLLYLQRWRKSRMNAARLSVDERRCMSANGSLLIQERNAGIGSREHWLLARGSDWMPIDPEVLRSLDPIMVARPKIDGPFDVQTGTDVTREWTVPRAAVLFHRATGTIIEILDQEVGLVYRHPRYPPTG
jgi:hypothetical protein